ncbi:MAG: hypothetical protein ACK4YU_07380 [Paracoccus sp. (in: a-proteobacteria)]
MTMPMVLTLDGAPFPASMIGALLDLTLHQSFGAPAVLQIRLVFQNSGLPDPVRPGMPIGLSVRGQPTPLFTGRVAGIALDYPARGMPTLQISAYDGLQPLSCRQSMLALQDASAADLAARLAADLGLDSHCAAETPTHPLIQQQPQQTDLGLLADIAAGAGLSVVLRGDVLMLIPAAGDGDEAVPLRHGHTLLSLRVSARSDPWPPGAQTGPQDQVARTVVAEGMAEGEARLIPGRIVRLDGVHLGLGGPHVLTRTTHRLTAAEGYVTEFSTEPPRRPRVQVSDGDDRR